MSQGARQPSGHRARGWRLALQVRQLRRTLAVLLAAPQWWLQPAEAGRRGLPHFCWRVQPPSWTGGDGAGMQLPSLQLGLWWTLVISLSRFSCWSNSVSAAQFFLPRRKRDERMFSRSEDFHSRISVFPGGLLPFTALRWFLFPYILKGAGQFGELNLGGGGARAEEEMDTSTQQPALNRLLFTGLSPDPQLPGPNLAWFFQILTYAPPTKQFSSCVAIVFFTQISPYQTISSSKVLSWHLAPCLEHIRHSIIVE